MIRAIFLDFEGVVTKNGKILHAKLFPILQPYATFEKMHTRYNKAKRGQLTYDEFVNGIPKEMLFPHLNDIGYRKGSREALKQLKKKYPLFLASNHIDVYFDIEIEKMQAKKFFNKLFVSDEMKCAKPDKEFFLKLIRDTKYKPNECVFVDDAKVNLKTAHEVGFITIWVNNVGVEDNRNKIEYKPDFEITDLRDLNKIIPKIK